MRNLFDELNSVIKSTSTVPDIYHHVLRTLAIKVNVKKETANACVPTCACAIACTSRNCVLLMLIILLSRNIFRQFLNHLNLKLLTESELLITKEFLAKVTPKIGQEKHLLLILC